MRVSVQKWGNSLGVRIPKTIAVESRIQQGSVVDLRLVGGKVVLTPVRKRRYTLEALLAKVNNDNHHPEVDTGPAVGRESW